MEVPDRIDIPSLLVRLGEEKARLVLTKAVEAMDDQRLRFEMYGRGRQLKVRTLMCGRAESAGS